MIRLYLDEDSMSQALVSALRARGVDVSTALEADLIARSDQDHLEFATSQSRALFTFNVSDYCSLHTQFLAESKSHAGIVLARQQVFSVGEQMRRLLRLIANVTAEDMRNRVEFLGTW